MSEHKWLSNTEIAEMVQLSAIFEVENCKRLLADLAEAKAIISDLTIALWGDQWKNLQLVKWSDLRERIRAVPGVVVDASGGEGEANA